MSKKKKKTVEECLLETYKKTGLSRRRFLRRVALQITGASAILGAMAKKAKSCNCGGCNSGCNSGCNVSCDVNPCDASNSCTTVNICNLNVCSGVNTCHQGNVCTNNRCEVGNVCTNDTCDFDSCPGTEDTCGCNTCWVANPCDVNVCEIDDVCVLSNICDHADVDCPNNDASCFPIVNSCNHE